MMATDEQLKEQRKINISKALNRERITKSTDLSQLDINFYENMRQELADLPPADQELLRMNMNSFVTSRLIKMLKLAAIHPVSKEIFDSMADEERELYRLVRGGVEAFQEQIYSGKQQQSATEDQSGDEPAVLG